MHFAGLFAVVWFSCLALYSRTCHRKPRFCRVLRMRSSGRDYRRENKTM